MNETNKKSILTGKEAKGRCNAFGVGYTFVMLFVTFLSIPILTPQILASSIAALWVIVTQIVTLILLRRVDLSYYDFQSEASLVAFNIWKRLMLSSEFKVVRVFGFFENTIQNTFFCFCAYVISVLVPDDVCSTMTATLLLHAFVINFLVEAVINLLVFICSLFTSGMVDIECGVTKYKYDINCRLVPADPSEINEKKCKRAVKAFRCTH